MKRGTLILLVCAVALVAFVLGRMTAPRLALVSDLGPPARSVASVPGERAMELARIHRVAVRVTADEVVASARADIDASLRNRLAAAGYVVVAESEPHDALIQARIEGFHFSAFSEYGAGSELHVVGLHAVELDGAVRMIPHDIWQSDSMRLARKDRLDAEALSQTEELLRHLLGAIENARKSR